jgi:SAM-dependent methyltransferase
LHLHNLYAELRPILAELQGKVLDVGCGEKPFQPWLRCAESCVGIDVAPGPNVDVVVRPCEPWPFENLHFDAVLCTEVLEHVTNCDELLREIDRVLKPEGHLVVTVPFIFNEHGAPNDFRRLSVYGVRELFKDRYDIIVLKPQGGIGTSAGTLFLGWIETQMNLYVITRFLKGALLPLWIISCGLVNLLGWLMDKVDRTRAFYSDVLMIARKRIP